MSNRLSVSEIFFANSGISSCFVVVRMVVVVRAVVLVVVVEVVVVNFL